MTHFDTVLLATNDLIGQLIAATLRGRGQIIAEAVTAEECKRLINRFVDIRQLIIVDGILPQDRALRLVRQLRSSHPQLRIVIINHSSDSDAIIDQLEAGVSQSVLSSDSLESVFSKDNGCSSYDSNRMQQLASRIQQLKRTTPAGPTEQLTSRERQIAGLANDGLRNKEIAQRLSLRLSTVKTHLENVYRKLHIQSRDQLAGAIPPIGTY